MENTETKIVEAKIAEYLEAEKELVDLFNSISEEKQQMFLEYLNQLAADRTEEPLR